jgi:hypothetical protein
VVSSGIPEVSQSYQVRQVTNSFSHSPQTLMSLGPLRWKMADCQSARCTNRNDGDRSVQLQMIPVLYLWPYAGEVPLSWE